MSAFFDSEEKVAALEKVAMSWVGTPFMANSNTKGPRGGVSCQKLVAEIYRELGVCEIQVPEVPMTSATFAQDSKDQILRPFMDKLCQSDGAKFCELSPYQSGPWPWPGDLLGFALGRIVHHCGIVLGDGRFIHAITHFGATINSLKDPTWGNRLEVYWRPIQ